MGGWEDDGQGDGGDEYLASRDFVAVVRMQIAKQNGSTGFAGLVHRH
jgi:hypothetical protein